MSAALLLLASELLDQLATDRDEITYEAFAGLLALNEARLPTAP
jgi:hypothetical protein